MKSALLLSCISGLLLAASGCGGGGSGSGSGPGISAPVAELATAKSGQAWNYQFSGTLATSIAKVPVSGTLSETYGATTVAGADLQAVASGTFVGAGQNVPFERVLLLHTDSGGNEYIVAVQDSPTSTPHFLSTPILYVPGLFSSTFHYSGGTIETDTGTAYNASLTVVGSESVTVPAGTFLAWKLTSSIVAGTVTTTQTEWIAPQVGNFVKATIQESDSSTPGVTVSGTAVLTSYNL